MCPPCSAMYIAAPWQAVLKPSETATVGYCPPHVLLLGLAAGEDDERLRRLC